MSTREIIQSIKQLPFNKRLLVIERVLQSVQESTDTQLEKAAKVLLDDYKNDKNLTAFTDLDFETFYEAR